MIRLPSLAKSVPMGKVPSQVESHWLASSAPCLFAEQVKRTGDAVLVFAAAVDQGDVGLAERLRPGRATSGVRNTGSSGLKAETRIGYGLPPPAGFHSVPNDSM